MCTTLTLLNFAFYFYEYLLNNSMKCVIIKMYNFKSTTLFIFHYVIRQLIHLNYYVYNNIDNII